MKFTKKIFVSIKKNHAFVNLWTSPKKWARLKSSNLLLKLKKKWVWVYINNHSKNLLSLSKSVCLANYKYLIFSSRTYPWFFVMFSGALRHVTLDSPLFPSYKLCVDALWGFLSAHRSRFCLYFRAETSKMSLFWWLERSSSRFDSIRHSKRIC